MRKITPVTEQHTIQIVADLADEIWNEHFPSIIGQAQVDYMLSTIQSVTAITAQLKGGQEYYLLYQEADPIGYLSLVADANRRSMMISKIYIKRTIRGSGSGQYLLDFVKHQCSNRGLGSIWLTVNRFNQETIDWYERRGFVVTDEVKKDIGGGFFMDDFIMELVLDYKIHAD